MKKIKIYGERNTGTNYLSRLIVNNLDVVELRGTVPNSRFWQRSEFNKNLYFILTSKKNFGWKHSCVNSIKIKSNYNFEDIGFVTLTKNPYSFLLSLYKNPYHYKGIKPDSFLDFLLSKWYVQKRDNIKAKYFNSPIDLWNFKNRSYIDLKCTIDSQTLNLKYEDLLANPDKILEKIANHFKINKRSVFSNYSQSTKELKKSFFYYRKYYLDEEWINKLSHKEIEIINQKLDPEIVMKYGYQLL